MSRASSFSERGKSVDLESKPKIEVDFLAPQFRSTEWRLVVWRVEYFGLFISEHFFVERQFENSIADKISVNAREVLFYFDERSSLRRLIQIRQCNFGEVYPSGD